MADYSLYDPDVRFAAAVAENALDMTQAFKMEALHGLFCGSRDQITP